MPTDDAKAPRIRRMFNRLASRYDALNRLTSSTLNGSLSFSATYDAAGNRVVPTARAGRVEERCGRPPPFLRRSCIMPISHRYPW